MSDNNIDTVNIRLPIKILLLIVPRRGVCAGEGEFGANGAEVTSSRGREREF
jgi:hypothetical protein